jgi:hypothetical protein
LKDFHYSDEAKIIRHRNMVTLWVRGMKSVSVNIETGTITYIGGGNHKTEFIALAIETLLKNKDGDESNSDVLSGTLGYRWSKSGYFTKYTSLYLPNNDLPVGGSWYYPLYDVDGKLWFYAPNGNGGGTVRLSPDQLLSTLKLCSPEKRYGAYVCADLKLLHSNFKNDEAYNVGRKRVGPTTHTDGFQTTGKAINDNYFRAWYRHPYQETVRDIIRCIWNSGELTRIDPANLSHWKAERLRKFGHLTIGVIDRWTNKKAPIVVFKEPIEYAENDFKNAVIEQMKEGVDIETAWSHAYQNIEEKTLVKQIPFEPHEAPENVLENIGLEIRFANKTY